MRPEIWAGDHIWEVRGVASARISTLSLRVLCPVRAVKGAREASALGAFAIEGALRREGGQQTCRNTSGRRCIGDLMFPRCCTEPRGSGLSQKWGGKNAHTILQT